MSSSPTPDSVRSAHLDAINAPGYPNSLDRQPRTIEFLQAATALGGNSLTRDSYLQEVAVPEDAEEDLLARTMGELDPELIFLDEALAKSTFVSLLGNPSISADGAIAFRARVQFTDSQNATRRRDGIFIRSGTQVRALTLAGNDSPEAVPFFRFRDLSLRRACGWRSPPRSAKTTTSRRGCSSAA